MIFRSFERRAWRVVFFGLCAFPAFVLSALLQLFGEGERAAAVLAWIGSRWLGVETLTLNAWQRWVAVLLSLVVLIVTLYLLTGIVINFAYPLRPGSQPGDWGGPTLAGRWLVHGLGGVLFLVATPFLCGLLRSLTKRMLRS